MAIYEYYCPTCRAKFEQRRPMSESVTITKCASGHRAERTISAFAMSRTGGGTMLEDAPMDGGGGGCCGGGGCACGN